MNDIVFDLNGTDRLSGTLDKAGTAMERLEKRWGSYRSRADLALAQEMGEIKAMEKKLRILYEEDAALTRNAQSIQTYGKAHGAVATSAGKSQMAMQNLIYAVDDASVSFTTGGFSGAIRGASNNLTTIAAQLGGLKTQIAAVGVLAVVQIGMKLYDNFDKAKKPVEDLTERMDRLQERLEGVRHSFTGIHDQIKIDRQMDPRAARERIDTLKDQARQLGRGGAGLDSEIGKLRDERDAFIFERGGTDQRKGLDTEELNLARQYDKEILALEKERADIRERESRATRERLMLEKELPNLLKRSTNETIKEQTKLQEQFDADRARKQKAARKELRLAEAEGGGDEAVALERRRQGVLERRIERDEMAASLPEEERKRFLAANAAAEQRELADIDKKAAEATAAHKNKLATEALAQEKAPLTLRARELSLQEQDARSRLSDVRRNRGGRATAVDATSAEGTEAIISALLGRSDKTEEAKILAEIRTLNKEQRDVARKQLEIDKKKPKVINLSA